MNHKRLNKDQPLLGKYLDMFLQATETLTVGSTASGKTMPFDVAVHALLRADPDIVLQLFDAHSKSAVRVKGDTDED